MEKMALVLVVLWPIVTTILAWIFHRKQNSNKGWTGGPISWPKSMWLAFTVCNWFFLPIWLLLIADFPDPLRPFFFFHTSSWWIRGVLELIMIYRWYNWTPKYGISHDFFHITICLFLLVPAWRDLQFSSLTPNGQAAWVYSVVVILTTIAEIWFAYLFFTTRSKEEMEGNIYFASDDPKWIFINRATASVVIPAYVYLYVQAIYLLIGRNLWLQ